MSSLFLPAKISHVVATLSELAFGIVINVANYLNIIPIGNAYTMMTDIVIAVAMPVTAYVISLNESGVSVSSAPAPASVSVDNTGIASSDVNAPK